MSDGTAAGTHVVGAGQPLTQLLLDDHLAYTTTEGVFVVDLTDSTPAAVRLSDGLETHLAYHQLQADSDQLYFTDAARDLKSYHLSTGTTETLLENVAAFRVVGEDGVFAIVNLNDDYPGQPSLWFSDGTAEGTVFVVDLTDYGTPHTHEWEQGMQHAAGLYNLL